jgi:hypothetical protein
MTKGKRESMTTMLDMRVPDPGALDDVTSSAEPAATFVDVTPEMAWLWLTERNTHNRSLSDLRASDYATQIGRKEWMVNGDTVRFAWPLGDEPPRLLDGQHRLEAIYRSGRVVRCLLVTGLDPESQKTIDQGQKRTPAQVLAMRGVGDPNNVAAAAQLCYGYTHRLLARKVGRERRATISQLAEFVDTHAETLATATKQGRSLREWGVPVTVSTAGAAYWVCAQASPGQVAAFWGPLLDGANLPVGSPQLKLRQALFTESRKGARRTESRIVLAWFIKTWNSWMIDDEVYALSWKPTVEPFPVASVIG